jgi:hypothetical protein
MKNLSFSFFTTNCNWFSQQDAWVYFNGKPNSQTFTSDPLKCYLKERWIEEPTKIYH